MAKVELDISTLSVLIAGLYCITHNTNAMAIPESLYLEIAEKLEDYLPKWDYKIISFESFIQNNIFIYPKPLLSDEDIEYMEKNTLYWERLNGNVVLSVSLDVRCINGEE